MESLLTGVSNGDTMEFSEDNGQGMTQPRMKEEAGRLQRRIRKLKRLLTKEITACIDKIGHFKTKYLDNFTEITTVKIDYALSILENHIYPLADSTLKAPPPRLLSHYSLYFLGEGVWVKNL